MIFGSFINLICLNNHVLKNILMYDETLYNMYCKHII